MTRMKRSQRDQPKTAIAAEPWTAVSRSEWLALLTIVLVGIVLRFAYPSRIAIEHFDEGVYSTNIFFSDAEEGQYRYRHLYAPPLLPFFIEMGMIFLGPRSMAPFLPALVLGVATIPLAWWAVRCWFGWAAGLVAGTLIATSDFHVLYSRTALTDVPVAFFILLSVYLYWEAIRRESTRWSIAAGIVTGLAWWTKYTGWLPIAIAGAGTVAWFVFERRSLGQNVQSSVKSALKCFAVMTATAFLVWSPVLAYLQPFGGYASVAENHRGYLRTASWLSNAYEQMGNVAAQSGFITALGAAFFGIAIVRQARFSSTVSILLMCVIGTLVVLPVLVIGPLHLFLLFAILGLCLVRYRIAQNPLVEASGPMDRESTQPRSRLLAIWLLLAWIVGMTITVPTYFHFPRLALMWLLPILLGASSLAGVPRIQERGQALRLSLIGAVLSTVLVFLTGQVVSGDKLFAVGWLVPGWQDRTDLERATTKIANEVRDRTSSSSTTIIIYVFAQPAAYFQLASALSSDRIGVMPAGQFPLIDDVPKGVEVFVVSAPLPSDELQRIAVRAELLRKVDYRPSTLVRLDGETHHALADPAPNGTYSLWFFRLGRSDLE